MITNTFQNSQLSINNNHSFKLIYIYQITCKDLKIKDNYIGQTECFTTRKNTHFTACKNSELKIYKIIRENGGWNNWQMKILSHYYCENKYDARQIEQKYIDFYKATMNSINAYSKPFKNEELDRQLEFELKNYSEKILGCFLYDFLLYSDEYDDYDENNEMNKCEYCKSEFKTDFNLKKHQNTAKYCLLKQKEINDDYEEIYYVCEYCDKKFTSKYNLNSHNNSCMLLKENIIKKQIEINEELNKTNEELNKTNEELNKTNEELNKKNEELKKEVKSNEELKKIIDKLNKKLMENDNIISKLEGRLELMEEHNKLLKELVDDTKHDVKDLCEKAINKPTTNNNVINNNQRTKIEIKEFNLDSEYVSSKISNKFNDKYMSGIAQFIKDHVITLEDGSVIYACFDNARRQFKYKDIYGNIIKDPN